MMRCWIYDPATDRFARVIRKGTVWLAQCHGRTVPFRDPQQAVAKAERMVAQQDQLVQRQAKL